MGKCVPFRDSSMVKGVSVRGYFGSADGVQEFRRLVWDGFLELHREEF